MRYPGRVPPYTACLRLAPPLALAALLAACAPDPRTLPPVRTVPPASAAGPHNARNALDWVGVYEGAPPEAACPGQRMRLALEASGGYELRTHCPGRPGQPELARGGYTWLPDGNTLMLDRAGDERRFFVAEGRVIALREGGQPPAAAEVARWSLLRRP